MSTTEMNARKRDYRANKYVARLLGDAAALKDDKGVSGAGATDVFWAHAWDMLNARMSYSGNTKMWQAYMCEVDPANKAQREAFRTLDADALEALHAIALGNNDRLQASRLRIAAQDLGFVQAYNRMSQASFEFYQAKHGYIRPGRG